LSQDPEKYGRELRSEERRAIIWLSYFGVAVALRIEYQRAIEAGQRPFVNFFCNYPCPHLTVYIVEALNVLIVFWFLYTICILLFFSEDWFHRWGSLGRQAREQFRRFANFFMFAYPALGGAFIIVSALSFLLPESSQSVYWIAAIYGLTAVGIWLLERVTGERNTLRVLAEGVIDFFKIATELVIEGLLPILEKMFKRLSKGKIPTKLVSVRLRVVRLLAKRKGRVKIRYLGGKKS
jgi:hypothetical protein